MYKYRYVPIKGDAPPAWEGECTTAEQALEQGRNRYADAPAIEVAEVEPMHYSELFPGVDHLFSLLQDRAHNLAPEEDDSISNSFDLMPAARKIMLHSLIVELIEEWETGLDPDQQLASVVVRRRATFGPDETARVLDQ